MIWFFFASFGLCVRKAVFTQSPKDAEKREFLFWLHLGLEIEEIER